MKSTPRTQNAVSFVAVLGLTYVLSQFLRTSNAVIAPQLMSEVGLGPADLGLLTGAFFLAFALVQVPVGIMLDRYGPRRVIALFMLLNVAGALLFATGESLDQLILARALMGVGCAPALMGAYVVFARWFEPSRFGTLSGYQLGIGNMGIILATVPLALAVETVGWRWSIGGTGLWAAVFALVIFVVIRDAPPGHPIERRAPETLGQNLKDVGAVLADRRLWPLMPLQCVGYASTAAILTLWSGPYLADIHGLDTLGRGNVLLLMALGSIAGALGFGPLDRVFNSRKRVVMIGAAGAVVVFATLAALPHPGLALIVTLFIALAVTTGYMLMLMVHIRSFFPDHMVGRGMTLANMINMGGVALIQFASGALLEGLQGANAMPGEADYRAVFAFLGGIVLVALAIYTLSRDRPPFEKNLAAEGQ